MQDVFELGYGTSIGIVVDGVYIPGVKVASYTSRRGLAVSFTAELDQSKVIDTDKIESSAKTMTATTFISNVKVAAAASNLDVAVIPDASTLTVAPPNIVVTVTEAPPPPVAPPTTHRVHVDLTLHGYTQDTFSALKAAFRAGVAEHLQVLLNAVIIDWTKNTVSRRASAVDIHAHVDSSSAAAAQNIAARLEADQSATDTFKANLQANGLAGLQGVTLHKIEIKQVKDDGSSSGLGIAVLALIGIFGAGGLVLAVGLLVAWSTSSTEAQEGKSDPQLEADPESPTDSKQLSPGVTPTVGRSCLPGISSSPKFPPDSKQLSPGVTPTVGRSCLPGISSSPRPQVDTASQARPPAVDMSKQQAGQWSFNCSSPRSHPASQSNNVPSFPSFDDLMTSDKHQAPSPPVSVSNADRQAQSDVHSDDPPIPEQGSTHFDVPHMGTRY